jgi:hypothetical protein
MTYRKKLAPRESLLGSGCRSDCGIEANVTLSIVQVDPRMIFGVSPTKDAVVIAQATGSGETFVIESIRSIQFQARTGDGLNELLHRLVVVFDLNRTNPASTIALLGSSSGRFKAPIAAIKGEAMTELAAARSGLPVFRVTAATLKKVLGCAPGQKWQARSEERFNLGSRRKSWSVGAAGAAAAAAAAAFKIAEGSVSTAN